MSCAFKQKKLFLSKEDFSATSNQFMLNVFHELKHAKKHMKNFRTFLSFFVFFLIKSFENSIILCTQGKYITTIEL